MTLATDNGDDVQIRDLQGKMIAHCEMAGDRMAILDCPPDMLPQEILEWRMNTPPATTRVRGAVLPVDRGPGSADQPADDGPRRPATWPACGAARTPPAASTRPRPTRSSSAPTGSASRSPRRRQGGLNKVGIKCIRAFPAAASRVWGARHDVQRSRMGATSTSGGSSTTSPESIMEGTQWSVFEPNDEKLWIQLRIAATNFLTRVWSDGALFGSTPAQAFLRQVLTPRPTRPK